MEMITASTGRWYYHAVIGDPDSDIAYEYYIQAGWGNWDNNNPDSASRGGYNGGTDFNANNATWHHPLHPSMAGNGSGAPNRTTFRLKIEGVGLKQDMVKDTLSRKPKISQQINHNELISNFVADMSTNNYTDWSTSGMMINTMSVIDSETGEVLHYWWYYVER